MDTNSGLICSIPSLSHNYAAFIQSFTKPLLHKIFSFLLRWLMLYLVLATMIAPSFSPMLITSTCHSISIRNIGLPYVLISIALWSRFLTVTFVCVLTPASRQLLIWYQRCCQYCSDRRHSIQPWRSSHRLLIQLKGLYASNRWPTMSMLVWCQFFLFMPTLLVVWMTVWSFHKIPLKPKPKNLCLPSSSSLFLSFTYHFCLPGSSLLSQY